MAIDRGVLLDIINELAKRETVFAEMSFYDAARKRLDGLFKLEEQHELLDAWHEFYRRGIISWGYNIESTNNTKPDWAHLTALGRRTIAERSRDPANPPGYLATIDAVVPTGTIARSYIEEALRTYAAGCDKATAVMVGAAAEALTIELRDELVTKMTALGKSIPKDLTAWQMKRALDALDEELQKPGLPPKLREQYEAFWTGFAGSLRMSRNDAGHPKSVEPVTRETVHAMLLMFPAHAQLTADLKAWVVANYT